MHCAKGIAGVDVAGRRLPKPKLEVRAGLSDGLDPSRPRPRDLLGDGRRARRRGSRFGYPPRPRPAAPRRRVSGRLRTSRASRATLRCRSTPRRTATSSSSNPNRGRDRERGRGRPGPDCPDLRTRPCSRRAPRIFVEPRRRRPGRWRRRRSSDAREGARFGGARRESGVGAGPGAGSRPAPGSHAASRAAELRAGRRGIRGGTRPRAETPAPVDADRGSWDSSGPESANRAPRRNPRRTPRRSRRVRTATRLLPPASESAGALHARAHVDEERAARVAEGVGAASPPSPGRLGDGIRPGDSNAGDPKNASPAVGDGAAPLRAGKSLPLARGAVPRPAGRGTFAAFAASRRPGASVSPVRARGERGRYGSAHRVL